MQRRSLFEFDFMTELSQKGTKQIEIPLLNKQQSAKQHWVKYEQQIYCVVDACNVSRTPGPTRYEQFSKFLHQKLSVINPESNFLLLWNMLNLIVIFYNFLLIPIIILIASHDTQGWQSWLIFNLIDVCFLLILLIDFLFIRFRVAYYENQELVANYNIILERYLKSGLLIDLLAFLVYFYDSLFRGYTMYVKIIFYIKLYTFLKIDKQIANKLMYYQYPNAIYKFIRMVGFIFFLTSLEACIYFAIDYYYYTQQGVNYDNGYLWLTSSQATYGMNLLLEFSWPAWYNFALYWAVQTTSAVGYGNMTPRNPAEVCLCNVVMLTTVCIFVSFANTILDIVDQLQQNTLRRQAKFTEINSFTSVNEVQRETRKKVEFYFDCLIQSKYDESEQFLHSIVSPNLQEIFNLCYRSFIFNNLQVISLITKDESNNWNLFARDLTSMMKVRYYSTGDYVQRQGKTSDFKLSIIERGKVTAFNDTIDYKKDFRVWDYFGQKQFFFGGISLTNVVCRTFTKFYYFEKEQFFEKLKQYRIYFEKCMEMVDDVKFNRKLADRFQLTCYNCDQYHVIECCPVATLWRNSLPKIVRNTESFSQSRIPHTRRSIFSMKRKELKKQALVLDSVYISKSYFAFQNA